MIDPSKDYSSIISTLTPTSDIHGNTISIGDTVRHHYSADLVDGRIVGMEDDPARAARVAYTEGVVVAIGTVTASGCKRYSIRVQKDVRIMDGVDYSTHETIGQMAYPPLNGVIEGRTDRYFGVEKITNPSPTAKIEASLLQRANPAKTLSLDIIERAFSKAFAKARTEEERRGIKLALEHLNIEMSNSGRTFKSAEARKGFTLRCGLPYRSLGEVL